MTAFVPGYPPSPRRFLARFLPPLAEGIAAHALEQHSQPGDLILNPFGQAPAVALEALQLGRRVLAASFNPVARLALSVALRPPAEADLRRALTLLGDARKEAQRLEDFVCGLYQTECEVCRAAVSADALEWDSGALMTRTYHCERCGAHRTAPATEDDRALAQRYALARLERHFLLERVAPLDDPDRPHAQEALDVYPARTLVALAALLNKLEALHPTPERETRRLLYALLVAACDAACPLGPERPRQLSAPKRFSEVNVWRAMEQAIPLLAGAPQPDLSKPLEELLAPGASPGIHAFTGRARELAAQLPEGACAMLLCALPRPNQAFWSLSALWSAWLWGHDSAAGLNAVLRRRRYDWDWNADALQRTFARFRHALRPNGRFIGLMPEAEPGFCASALAAADAAGYRLLGAALRHDTGEARFVWMVNPLPSPAASPEALPAAAIRAAARDAAVETLRRRGEPTRWPQVHFGAWRGLAEGHHLAMLHDDAVSTVNHLLEPVFRDARTFARFDAQPDDELSVGRWALPEGEAAATPLADRVELEVWRVLSQSPEAPVHTLAVMQAACAAFPGAETPGQDVVLACLSSYAQEVAPDQWQLRAEDWPTTREAEMEQLRRELTTLARRYGYEAEEQEWLEWREAGQTIYAFAVLASAAFSSLLFRTSARARRRFLVLPGGRAGLAAFKLRRDPRLRAALVRDNGMIVKFRHVRRMAGDTQLTRATLEPAFYADPLEEARQLQLEIKT